MNEFHNYNSRFIAQFVDENIFPFFTCFSFQDIAIQQIE